MDVLTFIYIFHIFRSYKNPTVVKKILFFNMVAAIIIIYLAAPSLSQAQVNLEEGLLIYYPFNGNADDESSNGYNGIINGAELTEDRFNESNKAYYFNRTENDNILVENQIPDLTVLSISVWIYLVDPDGNATIFCDATTVPGNDFLLNVTGESIGMRADKGDAVLDYEDGAVFDLDLLNAWHHIVWLMSNTSSSIYLDGNHVFTVDEVGSCVSYHALQASLGRRHVWEEADQYFDGKLDEFRLYNRLLNQDEIQSLHDINSGASALQNDKTPFSIYPNPSSEYLTFTFVLQNPAHVELKILDKLGQLVADIMDKSLPSGQCSTTWNVKELPSGIYFYRITADRQSSSAKIVLMK
jgi:hypothetical protein